MNDEMNDDMDRLLRNGLLQPPDQFSELVMRRVRESERPEFEVGAARTGGRSKPAFQWLRLGLRWLALLGAALVGAVQLAGFMFGLWAASAAG